MQLFPVSRSLLQGKMKLYCVCDFNKEAQKHILPAMQRVRVAGLEMNCGNVSEGWKKSQIFYVNQS